MRLLVTGATGFVGRHLVDLLIAEGSHRLAGLARSGAATPDIPLHLLDLTTTDAVASVLRDLQPEGIFHLAGYANTSLSFREPAETWRQNLEATLSLYRAVEAWGGRPRILFVSSGAVYGDALQSGACCDEYMELLPNSPYAASKAAADLASFQAYCHPGLPIVRVRPFNQFGPGQTSAYAVSAFAEQIARIESGQQPPILKTGNLDAERDLTDVRDMVRAYLLLWEKGQPGEVYNAGRGEAVSMKSVVGQLLALTPREIHLQIEGERLRPTELATMRIKIDKLQRTTGWKPERSLSDSLRDVLDDWRRRVVTT